MRTVTTVAAMQRLTRHWRRNNQRVSFVPTMGYLHDGHLSLIRRARQLVGQQGRLVVSIYVNPTQFGPDEDLNRYPRDLHRDKKLCRQGGVDFLFLPNDRQMYPGREAGEYSTYIVEESLSKVMEGVSRPTHFRGVATVVAKLFNVVRPDVAVFGAKDFQQTAIIQRLVRDLSFPVRIVVAPTIREPDGLAMSSRNKYLEGDLRSQARALGQAIKKAQATVTASPKPVEAARLKHQLRRFIENQPAARVDYIEFFQPATLQAVGKVQPGDHMALAVFIGKTRLIDNGPL
jgi:pantoate--beta-alanine ligase